MSRYEEHNLRQDLNGDFHIFEEIKIFQYLGTLIIGKMKLMKKLKREWLQTVDVVMSNNVIVSIEM
jgi:hypothetical protein